MSQSPTPKNPEAISIQHFSQGLQERFASFSGDLNPIHMDELVARRTPAGSPVVHGMHVLLWALDALVAAGRIRSRISGVKAKFAKWVYVGDQAELIALTGFSLDPTAVSVEARGINVIAVELTFDGHAHSKAEPADASHVPEIRRKEAAKLSFSELEGRSGVAPTGSYSDATAMFPALAQHLGSALIAEFAACSYVVGMEVPGLYSTLSKLDVEVHPYTDTTPKGLKYEVVSRDERFHKAVISVLGNCIHGRLAVFYRQPPVQQASLDAVAAVVQTSEFSKMRAIIIGGSRGLGELAAKIIAAGGGSVTITYAKGQKDAEDVAAEIKNWGGTAETMRFDIREPTHPQLVNLPTQPTHVFYFATSAIFRSKDRLVSADVLNDFVVFYLHGFFELCSALIQIRRLRQTEITDLIAYYPSSVAIDERPAGMTEYAMIKSAGEQMCRDMNQYIPGLRILTTRLPRLKTDQTASVLPVRESDPLITMLAIVRTMCTAATT